MLIETHDLVDISEEACMLGGGFGVYDRKVKCTIRSEALQDIRPDHLASGMASWPHDFQVNGCA